MANTVETGRCLPRLNFDRIPVFRYKQRKWRLVVSPSESKTKSSVALLKGLQQEGHGEGWVFPSDKSP
jgi:hypothetical protein